MDNKQWHGGKGSKRRNSNDSLYADNWEKIFGKKKPEVAVRKETPNHATTQIHKDQTKVIPRRYKYNNEEQI
jgi:hypothetical protein